jgi:hypothetical protein
MKARSPSRVSCGAACSYPTRRRPITAAGLLMGLLTINGTALAATAANPGSTTTPVNPGTSTTNPGASTTSPGASTTTGTGGNTNSTTKRPVATTTPNQTTNGTATQFETELSGYNEVIFSGGGGAQVPPPAATLRGAISTQATGNFTATVNSAGDIIDYELTYSGLESDVTQAHIHFGQRHTVGGIVVWLCQTATNPAPEAVRNEKLTPLCQGPRDGTIKGTITPDEVLEVTGQGIAAKEFDELVRALQNRAAYANVHTQTFPQGEIRGEIRASDEISPEQPPRKKK